MKMRAALLAAVVAGVVPSAGFADTLIDLRFDAGNPDDVAAHADVSSVQPWTNGSLILDTFFGTAPTENIGSGNAELTVPHGGFGYVWGFDGGFDIDAGNWIVTSVTFDYDVLGHNGEASMLIRIGSLSATLPLPSTSSADPGTSFGSGPAGPGTQATGTVSLDFVADTATVTYGAGTDYSTGFLSSLTLTPGTQDLRISASNFTPRGSLAWDANFDSTAGSDAFYRIDNLVIEADREVPEPATVATVAGGLILISLVARRRRG